MISRSNSCFIISSSSNNFIEKTLLEISNLFSEKEILKYDGANFDKKNFIEFTNLFDHRNGTDKEIIFLFENFDHVKRNIQSKMLVRIEELFGNKSFILITKNTNSVLPAILSRGVVFSDTDSTFKYNYHINEIKEISKMIENKDLFSFENLLSRAEEMKTLKKIMVDLMNMSAESIIDSSYLDKLVVLYETSNLTNSINIVKIKLLEIIF